MNPLENRSVGLPRLGVGNRDESASPWWAWPAERSSSPLKHIARETLHSLARTSAGKRALKIVLKDHETRSFLFQHLSNLLSARASFESDAPATPRLEGFADCAWLLSSNPLNHGLSRLSIAEAAYLYKTVSLLHEPEVAEIGRFRGGTTFLLAAAGGLVVSLDLSSDRQRADDLELAHSLAGFGLEDRVELLLGDSHSYSVGDRRFDLVFVDGDHVYAGVRADFENWWPAVRRPGGHMLFHDAIPGIPLSDGVVRLVEEVRQREDTSEVSEAPDTLVHFVKLTSAAA
jgi:predicted O-methyltransferase YrrM